MRKKLISMSITLSLFLGAAGMALAATEADKRAAIDNGLAWLATQQNAAGAIGSGGVDYLLSQTGSALLAFLEEKPNWGANAATYQEVVDKGFNYLLSNVSVVSISPQPAGNPDADGNGVGVKLYPGGTNSRDTYVTGIALPAIAKSGTPDDLVSVGALAGRTDGSGAGGAWTYKDVVQNTIDYYAFGQSDPATGNYRGGWRYYANYGNSDQSTTQWPVISSLYATEMGVSTPGFVKSELAYWTDYIQNPTTGAAGYMNPYSPYGEINETGALLIMQDFLGWGTSDVRVQKALSYLNTHWQETANSTYDGNFGHPYAMWAVYKGLELTIGLDDTTYITNLRPQGGTQLDPGDTWNWWEDYCEYLVQTQGASGNWVGYSYWNQHLATAWNINILAATKIPGGSNGGDPVPEPSAMLLFGTSLLGLAGYARRRKKE
jgi:hypothetical protein